MMLRFLLPFFLLLSLHAKEKTWYSKIDTKIEAGVFLPDMGGTITNSIGVANFESDFGYEKSTASYFALELILDYDYAPNFNLNFMSMKENSDVTLSRGLEVADGSFNSSVSTVLDYSIANAVFYQDFKKKGKWISVFGKPYYSGDLEFDVGLNVKMINWNFEIQDKTDLSKASSWIKVNEFIPLPYLGFKYYLYNLTVYANVSALSFNEAKSTSFEVGVDYRIINGLYLSAGYLYEQFKAVEKHDTIDFDTAGYKFSFKYAF